MKWHVSPLRAGWRSVMSDFACFVPIIGSEMVDGLSRQQVLTWTASTGPGRRAGARPVRLPGRGGYTAGEFVR
ncbi:hypothetical protein GCM10009759_27070 [Kitasatospora saccharophila]|uniref:Uncharacterized protein n=1 Tax=Kitasatospora saccharophila TaxID=407973 RepID=A0ABN2WQP2_9ACTN